MPDVLRCDLTHVRLSSLLQLTEAEGASGWLLLGDWGRVGLQEGLPTVARCGPLEGYSALVTMFFIEHGEAVLRLEEAPQGASLGPVVRAIMDGLRLVDEWRRIGPLVLGRYSGAPPEGTSEEVSRVVARLDGSTPVQEIVVQLNLSPARVTDGLIDLLENGHLLEVGLSADPVPWRGFHPTTAPAAGPQVEVEAEERPGVEHRAAERAEELVEEDAAAEAVTDAPGTWGAATPSADPARRELSFEVLIARGRALLREGDLDASEAAFEAAVALRPDDRIAAQNLRRVRAIRRGDGGVGFRSWQRAPT